MRTGVEVVAITTAGDAVSGVELADGSTVAAPVVVANADAEHVYADLLPDPEAIRHVHRAGRSTSGLIVLVAATGTTPGIHHHNVWFSADDRAEFAALDAGRMADDPTIYACVSLGHGPDPGAARLRELVPARQHAAWDPARPRPGA